MPIQNERTPSQMRRKPTLKQRLHKNMKKIYNKEENLCMGKQFVDIFKLMLYYGGFMLAMFILFLIMLSHFKRKMEQGPGQPPIKKMYIMSNAIPGIAFVPSATSKQIEHSIIWYTHSGEDSVENRRSYIYGKIIKAKLKEQERKCHRDHKCSSELFDPKIYGPCGQEPHYGYDEHRPCLFIKLNRLANWVPEPYENESYIPSFVPEDLKSKIKPTRQALWLHCKGRSEYDQAHLGNISYYPGEAFNESYFPILTDQRLSPMVAIKLDNIEQGFILQLSCNVFAKNIPKLKYHTTQVYIEKKKKLN